MKTRVSNNGRIVLPVRLRERDGIQPGNIFEVDRIGRGEYRLSLETTQPNAGVFNWLLACPSKGWFKPVASETTATL